MKFHLFCITHEYLPPVCGLVVLVAGAMLCCAPGCTPERRVCEGRVARVLTGARIVLHDGTRVQYAGLSVPSRGKPYYEQCRQANSRLVRGAAVRVVVDARRSAGSKALHGQVYVGDTLVNAALISQGYALADPRSADASLWQLQHNARVAGRGLWAREDAGSAPYYVGSRRRRIFHRPGCLHARHLDFDDRVIFRRCSEALEARYRPDWRCCPLFAVPANDAISGVVCGSQ